MNAMWTSTAPHVDERGVAFLARLVRLLNQVEELNRQLERIEAETQEALRRTAHDGHEEHR
jgi:CCR4-NOT transcriptional regulation complex NOT5 subunit